MVRRSHKTRGGKRKQVPWAGWSKIKPEGHARTVMLRDCGKKCFLGPKKSFPICAKGTCKVSDKGLYAAYIRAKEWGNPRRSYKGKARPRHNRGVYSRVARKASRALVSRGHKVGRGGGRRRRVRTCPKGSHHKIRGQKRNTRGYFRHHGKFSRKCYRN